MSEKLIAGYTAYTDADEFGTALAADAPASVESAGWALISFGVSMSGAATIKGQC